MIIRNAEGIIKIISRKDSKNEKVYNKKIYDIMNEYRKKYNSIYSSKCMNMNSEVLNGSSNNSDNKH
jgi:hypothetical protein